MAVLLGLLLLGLPAVVAPPAGAVELPFELTLVEGSLEIRDAEEPAALGAPTTFTGIVDDASGVLPNGDFSAAPLDFQFDITDPIPETIYVDATFTQLAPGGVTGTVTKLSETEAAVALDVDVRVDLHIEVGNPAFLVSDCVATPVSLRLTSTVPYDSETGRVTLTDADFRVPPVPTGSGCADIVAGGVNERLAGGGHSITMVMEGQIPNIRIGVAPTATALAVDPAWSRAGDAVTFTADVALGPDAPAGTPSGVVEFRDGATVLGTDALDGDGRATFTTSSLAVGDHAVTATYQGDETYAPSTSPAVDHLVAQAPTVTLPETVSPVVIGGNPRPVTVQVANPADLGVAIENGRLDVTIARVGSATSAFDPSRIVLEWFNEGAWEPVPLVGGPPGNLKGSVGPATGAAIPAGSTSEVRLRLTAPVVDGTPSPTACGGLNPTCPGPLLLTASLSEVDPSTGAVSRAHAHDDVPVDMIETTRRPTTMAFAGGVPRPHTLRQGYTLLVSTPLTPNFGAVPWSGLAEVYIDGIQVPLRDPALPFADGYADQFKVKGGVVAAMVLLPTDIEPGRHAITVRYLGDALHGPAEVTSSYFVHPSAGHPFTCREKTLTTETEWGANLVFDADLPATVASGATIEVPVSDALLLMHRPTASGLMNFVSNNATASVGTGTLEGITFGLGPDGSGTAGAISRAGGTAIPASPNPAPESAVDQTYTFTDLAITATVSGEPGEQVPVVLEEVVIDHRDGLFGFPMSVRCFARDDQPMVLGEVEMAGTSVSVSPELAREGTDAVEVQARTFPAGAAGTVAFSSDLDGALGTDTVDAGVASLAVEDLSPGRHVITAAFDATDPGVPDTSGTAAVTVSYSPRSATERFVVAARTDYLGSAERADVVADAAALDEGVSRTAYLDDLSRSDAYLRHVVDGMYLDTLGREGDEDGVAFWVGRLRAGWTVARVAANFYASDEYVARVGGADEAWIRDLYGVLLGREADGAGLAYWIGEVRRRGRGGVALAFFQTPESARARVTALYQRFLGRNPNTADRNFWANRVIVRGDLVLAVELTLSPEYGGRAENRFPLV